MKKIIFISLLFSCQISFSQNLVPNPSFEDSVYCPSGTNDMNACVHWSSFGNSPDYFNSCNSGGLNVPYSQFGFQNAHTGNAMTGLVTYRNPLGPDGPNYREFIGIALTSSLTVGQKYYFSFFTNFSFGPSVSVACNKIGLRFFRVSYSESNEAPIDNYTTFSTDSIISDSSSWIKLSGSFISDSSYSFLSIGNFFVDNLTDTSIVRPFADYSYYYIDDVCVTTDSLFNEEWTGLPEYSDPRDPILFYPNPASSELTIESRNQIDFIRLINSMGRIVFENDKISNNIYKIILSNFSNGLYYVQIKIKNKYSQFNISVLH